MLQLILLSGGSGSRLWPLSNNSRSKQFLKVLRDEENTPVSMVQRVFAQVEAISTDTSITIATSESQQNSIERQLKGDYSLVLEPERRDTAPAIMLACANLYLEQQADLEDVVVVMPIDTYADQAYYDHALELEEAVRQNVADIVLLGVQPTYPSEKYGYIIPEESSDGVKRVSEFKEKPDAVQAQCYIEKGGLWNCGVFAFKLKYLLKMIKHYMDVTTFEEMQKNYRQFPKNSFDYEVVEKANSIAVIPYDGTWKDLGTWNTLTDEMTDTQSGRAVIDEKTCNNIHVINETGLPLVVSGLKDAVVVATHDGILVCDKENSSSIKPLVEKASESRPMYEKRRWGEYRVLDISLFCNNRKALTKELVIEAGKQLSYQRHAHRSETWTIVAGSGEIVLNGETRLIKSGDTVIISENDLHAIRAFEEIHAIEVQLGDLLEESDIERFEDFWNE